VSAIDTQLPRELVPGVHWLGACLVLPYGDILLHSVSSLYVLQGDEASVLIDGGLPLDFDIAQEQLKQVLADGPPLRYIWPTHQETPHAGCAGLFLEQYPDALLVGDTRDYHLIFPQFADRFRPLPIGGSLDLGGTEAQAISPIFYDVPGTQWVFDTRRRVLFSADGFAYAHLHLHDQCGRVAEEVSDLDIPQMTELFSEASLWWSRYHDMAPLVERLEDLVAELDVALVAPGHGLPITELARTFPKVVQGLLSVHRADE
jgi:flavorubredoxin